MPSGDRPSRMNLRAARTRVTLAAVAAVAIASVAACSGGSGSSDDASGGSIAAADEPARAAADSGATIDRAENGASEQVSEIDLSTQALIRTATVDLETDDVGAVVEKVRALVVSTGGRIGSEQSATGRDGEDTRAHLEVLVPVAKFDLAYEEIPTYATLLDRAQSTEDVTAQVADIDSRVASAQDAIDQLRALFTRATKLGEVIALERELSQREADLEALQAQQRALEAQTSMSTIVVNVSTAADAAPPADDDQAGFLSGIKQGWDGLVTLVVGGSHVVGLVLPIAALLALLAGVGYLVVRRVTPRDQGPGRPQPSE